MGNGKKDKRVVGRELYSKRLRSRGDGGRGSCEALERRILLSKVGPLIDAGDVQWLDTESRLQKLLRATDMVLVGFGVDTSSTRVRRLSAALTGKTGALAGYSVLQAFDVTSVLFQRTARGNPPSLDSLLDAARDFPDIKHLSPTFFTVPDNQRVIFFDTVYVHLQNNADPATVFAKGFSTVTPAAPNAFDVSLRRGGAIDALRVAETLRQQSYVQLVGADNSSIPTLSSAPNDPHYANGDQWNVTKVGLSSVWDNKTTGSSDVVIAVLDNGVQIDHPDLKDNIFVNRFEIGNDSDGNGFIGDVNGWNFYENNGQSGPSSTTGSNADNHGTAVAGVAAATGNNSIGVTGAARHVKILPLRMIEGFSFPNPANIANAIKYAAGFNTNGAHVWPGADVISGSWGGMNPNASITDAFALASGSGRGGLGMPIFMASGNSGASSVQYPGNLTTVIAVGASTSTDARAGYSQYGSALDIVAPSSNYTNTAQVGFQGVWSTDRTDIAGFNPADTNHGGDYLGFFNGTSAATPLAAGVAALLLSYNPNLTATSVRNQILNNAYTNIAGVKFINHFNSQYGFGRLDAAAAFNGVSHDTTAPSVSSVSISNDDGNLSTRTTKPTLTFTFSERPYWSPGDITVTRSGVPVTGFRIGGSFTGPA